MTENEIPKAYLMSFISIRITKKRDLGFEAVNYSKWNICADACKLGSALGVPLYKFLKDPLIRKYGKSWYDDLVSQIEIKN